MDHGRLYRTTREHYHISDVPSILAAFDIENGFPETTEAAEGVITCRIEGKVVRTTRKRGRVVETEGDTTFPSEDRSFAHSQLRVCHNYVCCMRFNIASIYCTAALRKDAMLTLPRDNQSQGLNADQKCSHRFEPSIQTGEYGLSKTSEVKFN